MSSPRDTDAETTARMSQKQSKQCCWWGPSSSGKGTNGGNGGNGKNGAEESVDLCQVAQTLAGVAKQLGDLAKALAKGACQEEEDPYLRQKVISKLRELLCKICAGAGDDLDLACLLRCLNCLTPQDSE